MTDLKVLDPAMGSGHFLTKATGYLAEEVMSEVREVEAEMGLNWDEQHVRREIAKECIYGVDLNGMTVELAKLSMWLETLAADRPLAFLDHHFKQGNSLIGSDVTEVLSKDEGTKNEQLTLSQALARVRQNTLEHMMELMEDLLSINNEALQDVRSMEEIYAEIRADPLYQRLFELTNVHTAEQFGLDVPQYAYDEMAGAIKSEEWVDIREKDWFQSAQTVSEDEVFFHWELEFPSVFFETNGEKADDAGFDAVFGNPPYGDILPTTHKQYCRDVSRGFESERADVFTAFVARAREVLRSEKKVGYILPNTFLRGDQYDDLRKTNSQRMRVEPAVDYNDMYVFDVDLHTTIVLLQNIE
jgi:type I restriction-modification system DNA methylase subunit